jgi:GMP synthase (glutamine-hydrolysing)
MKTAIAIRFVHFENLGTLENLLRERDFEVKYIEAASGRAEELGAINADHVISLGGPIGAYEGDLYPFLNPILSMLERRVAADQPTLGICLGSQLIARAAGARVYPGSGKEIGWSHISLTADGQLSPLRHLASTPVLHWHGDTFDLPRGSTLLASTDRYLNQAFSLGRNVLGVQFHPEVTAAGLEHWYVGHACEIAMAGGVDVRSLRSDTRRFASPLKTAAEDLLREWLRLSGGDRRPEKRETERTSDSEWAD